MKNIFFLFNFIYFSISFAQQKTDWELWNLKNAPKEVTYIYRQALPDSLIDKKNINSYQQTLIFNKNGLKIEENIQNTTVVRYKYDKNGNSIREEYYDYASGKLNSINTLEYEYDNKNNWTKQTRFYNNSPSYYTLGLIKYSPSSEK